MMPHQNDAINDYKNYELAFLHFTRALDNAKRQSIADIAMSYADIFNIDASFFFYAMDFGVEVAMEYWINNTKESEQKFYQSLQHAFAKANGEEQMTDEVKSE